MWDSAENNSCRIGSSICEGGSHMNGQKFQPPHENQKYLKDYFVAVHMVIIFTLEEVRRRAVNSKSH